MTLLLTRLTYLTALPLSASEGTLFTPPVCAGAVVRGMSLEVVLTGSTHCPVSWIPAQRPLSLSMGLHGAVARARPTRAHAPAFSVRSPDATSRAPSSVPPRHLALGLSVPRRGRLHYMPGVNDGGKFSSVSLVLLSYLGQNAKAHACRLEEDVS